jgi:hypothetical protein
VPAAALPRKVRRDSPAILRSFRARDAIYRTLLKTDRFEGKILSELNFYIFIYSCQDSTFAVLAGAHGEVTGLPGSSAPALRNTIEGLNGLIKDPAHEALAQPGRRRVRGIAAQSLFTAPLRIAANIRKNPRLAGTHPRRQGPHRPAGPAAPHQPPRLSPRRVTSPPEPRAS